MMDEQIGQELVKVLQQPEDITYVEAFERAFELTKTYAGSAGAQASAIPVVFEKMFELFATGKGQS
jgi:hypothetical protein